MKALLGLLLITFFLTSCTDTETNRKISALEAKVSELSNQMSVLEETINSKFQEPLALKQKKGTNDKTLRTASASDVTPKSNTSSFDAQCMATTKKGTRCRRTARSNGYCWQHGG